MLAQPNAGDCNNDSLVISQVDAVSTKVVPMSLCGTLTGQHSKSPVISLSSSYQTFSVPHGQELRSRQDCLQCYLHDQYVSLEDPCDPDHV